MVWSHEALLFVRLFDDRWIILFLSVILVCVFIRYLATTLVRSAPTLQKHKPPQPGAAPGGSTVLSDSSSPNFQDFLACFKRPRRPPSTYLGGFAEACCG